MNALFSVAIGVAGYCLCWLTVVIAGGEPEFLLPLLGGILTGGGSYAFREMEGSSTRREVVITVYDEPKDIPEPDATHEEEPQLEGLPQYDFGFSSTEFEEAYFDAPPPEDGDCGYSVYDEYEDVEPATTPVY